MVINSKETKLKQIMGISSPRPILSLPNYKSFRKPRDTLDRENNITSLLSFLVGKQRLDTANCLSLSQIPLPY